jgi:hypothetical protein
MVCVSTCFAVSQLILMMIEHVLCDQGLFPHHLFAYFNIFHFYVLVVDLVELC